MRRDRGLAGTERSVGSSERVALGGIVSALCLLSMFSTGVMPALYIAAPMVAGILLTILVVEVSNGWAFLTYLAVSLLTLVVTYDKEAALMFVLFFGYYPLLRPFLMRLRWLWRLLGKLLLWNGFLLVDYWLTVYVLGMPTFSEYSAWVLAVLANAVFQLYDSILGRLKGFYGAIIKPKLLGRNH